MTDNNMPPRTPIHGYDIRHYFERPNGLDTEIHCYRNRDDAEDVKHDIVLHMCFYLESPPQNTPDYTQLPITFNYPLERLAPIFATLQSGAPLELFLEVHNGKLCHRLHANTIGWLDHSRVATVDSETHGELSQQRRP